MAYTDKEKEKANQSRYRARNRERRNEQKRRHYTANRDRLRLQQAEYRRNNREAVYAANAAWRAQFWPALRSEMIAEFGARCVCCSEAEIAFLELDHIFNDGAEQRRKHKNGQQELLALRRAGWPKDRHQLLCANCNRGKLRNGGICPHRMKNQS